MHINVVHIYSTSVVVWILPARLIKASVSGFVPHKFSSLLPIFLFLPTFCSIPPPYIERGGRTK